MRLERVIKDLVLRELESEAGQSESAQATLNHAEPVYRASGVGQCLRKQYYQATREETTDPPSPESLLRMKFGDYIHDLVQKVLLKHGHTLGYEVTAEERLTVRHPSGLLLTGKYDLLLRNEHKEETVLIDIKSVDMRKLKYLRTRAGADPHHIAQLSFYDYLLKTVKNIEPTEYKVLYITRNDLTIHEVDVEPVQIETAWRSVEHDLSLLASLPSNTPPPPEPRFSWECRYCPFVDLCERQK